MIDCDHFEGRTRGGRKLAHADQTEQQIRLGLQLTPEELVSWIRTPSTSESLVEEAIVFLLLHHRATGDHALVETLAAASRSKDEGSSHGLPYKPQWRDRQSRTV